MLDRGADPNAVGSDFAREPGFGALKYVSPLYSVVTDSKYARNPGEAANALDAVRLLLGHGADPNFTGRDADCSMLQAAAPGATLSVVELLLEHGMQGQPQPNSPMTDAFFAYHRHVTESETRKALRSEANPEHKELVQHHEERVQSAIAVARRLVDAGVSPEVVDDEGKRLGSLIDLLSGPGDSA